jgi:putative ABC transport system ATP-binding protein
MSDVELNEIRSDEPSSPKTQEFREDSYFGDVRLKEDDPHAEDDDTLIAMKNVHKTYLLGIEGVPALRGVSLTVKRGEFVCIFGTSGGGKTTMLNIMGTIDKPTKGELKLCGVTVNSNTKDTDLSFIRLQKVGFVFQTFNLLSSLTAQENVEMPMILNGVLSQSDRKQRAKELLTMVGMQDRLDHVPSQLSGGEQQRVTIARAISNNPELLLLDEPTGDLDTVNTLIVMQLLTELNQKNNITMVMVTHDVGLKSFADRIVWMRDGKIQRIEVTSQTKKRETLKKLQEDIDALKEKKKRTTHGTETLYRNPTDYKTHRHLVEERNKKASNGVHNSSKEEETSAKKRVPEIL